MTSISRIVLCAEGERIEAEVSTTGVCFQEGKGGYNWISVSHSFLSDVVDAVIQVTGQDDTKLLEEQLESETRRRIEAEAAVRALEGQLAVFRSILAPKSTALYADQED